MHYLCKQLTCSHQICIVGALSDMGAASAWDLTYFWGHRGQNENLYFFTRKPSGS